MATSDTLRELCSKLLLCDQDKWYRGTDFSLEMQCDDDGLPTSNSGEASQQAIDSSQIPQIPLDKSFLPREIWSEYAEAGPKTKSWAGLLHVAGHFNNGCLYPT